MSTWNAFWMGACFGVVVAFFLCVWIFYNALRKFRRGAHSDGADNGD